MDKDVVSNLAKNIIQLRSSKGFTQGELAEKSGLPRSTVTYLESGAANPSLKNLLAVAGALQVGLEALISKPRPEVEHIPARDVPVQSRVQGRARMYKLLPDKIKGMNIDRMELDRGTHMPGHAHLSGTKEYLTVVEGEITVYTQGRESVVKTGDVLAFSGDQPHAYRNTGGTRAVAFSVVIPVF